MSDKTINSKFIPDIIVGRLPIYLLALQHMQEEGRHVTSSQELAERLGISAAQIRKDLSQFGEFGKQGTGYTIGYLADQLRKILHLDKIWDVALVGAGDMGHAICGHDGFQPRGFDVVMVFDSDPKKIGTKIHGLTVEDVNTLEQRVNESGIKVGMIAVPAQAAQQVADKLVKAGVKAILNYAPITLNLPSGLHVEYIDPLIYLQRMAYYLNGD